MVKDLNLCIIYYIQLHNERQGVSAIAYQFQDALQMYVYFQGSDTEASFYQVLEVSCLWCACTGTCLPVYIAVTPFLLQHSSKAN